MYENIYAGKEDMHWIHVDVEEQLTVQYCNWCETHTFGHIASSNRHHYVLPYSFLSIQHHIQSHEYLSQFTPTFLLYLFYKKIKLSKILYYLPYPFLDAHKIQTQIQIPCKGNKDKK